METRNIKDFIHLYLGCECQLFWRREDGILEFERIGELITIKPEDKDHHGLVFKCKTSRGNFSDYAYPYSDVKPILRPLSDMTEEEISNAIEPMTYGLKSLRGKELHLQAAELTKYLLSKHFDIFGLIESGLALDATLIQNTGTSPTK